MKVALRRDIQIFRRGVGAVEIAKFRQFFGDGIVV